MIGLLTLIFGILLILVCGKLLWLAIKAAWSITKILFTIVFLPIVLIAIAVSGLISLAFVGLIGIGLFALLAPVH